MPIQPAGAARQVQDGDASSQTQGRIEAGTGGSQPPKATHGPSEAGAATTTAAVQDPHKTTSADDKKRDKNQNVDKEQVEKAVSSVNDYIKKLRHRVLEFSMDEKNERMVIKIMDTDTKEMIRQIPSEEMLRLADSLGKDKGWLLEQKA
ncbi:flagellar protein FlaG [Gammaproteobacteria bacterium]